MADSNIIFEPGSGSYDSSAELFRFNAYDGDVLCAISRYAFQALAGTLHLDPASADEVFVSWENSVFDIARTEYAAGELQEGCALVVRASDIAIRHLATSPRVTRRQGLAMRGDVIARTILFR